MRYGDIRFYDKDFNLIAILPKYISVNWNLCFKDYGTVEIHLEKNSDTVKLLTENKYLLIEQGNMQAVVSGIKIDTDCTIFARTTEWLLTKFLVCDLSAEEVADSLRIQTISASKLCCYAVSEALPESVKIVTEELENDETDLTDYVSEKARDVYTIVKECLKDPRYGFSFGFDAASKCFVFKVLYGNENNGVAICDEYKNLYDSTYTLDFQNEASGGIYYHDIIDCGEWDAARNAPALTITPANYGKYYTSTTTGKSLGLHVAAGNIIMCKDKDGSFSIVKEAKPFPVVFLPEDRGIFSWYKSLSKTDEEEATKELSKYREEEGFSCKTKNIVFGQDLFLGDIVRTGFTAQNFLVSDKKIITNVHIWEEAGDYGCIPTAEKYEQ